MKAGFLTSEQVFSERGLELFERIDALAKATDFALALSDDSLAEAVETARRAGADKVCAKDAALQEKL